MQWEYLTFKVLAPTAFLSTGGDFDEALFLGRLNECGMHGWELVSVFDTNSVQGGTRWVVAVMKRQKQMGAVPPVVR